MFKSRFIAVIFVGILSLFSCVQTNAQSLNFWSYDPLDNMPILEKTPDTTSFAGAYPIEQRGPEFRKFLAASVKISVGGASGSGTIIHYDPVKNLAYVASCGHLWNSGIMTAEEGKQRNMTCKIIVWYQNEKKLQEAKSYNANVIFYSYIAGQDTSLLTFTPDWKPDYFPIAPVNYQYKQGSHFHSLGCDGGNEVAHYDVEVVGLQGGDIVTQLNSPRPGRSGGGLMDDIGYYIGTCWGTQYRDGSGIGFFTPLSAIHRFWSQQKGYDFLLTQKIKDGLARQIPIRDRVVQEKVFPEDYILLPIP
jgi:hypothetical protein